MTEVLFIGAVWPEPTATAAGKRTLEIIDLLQANKYQVSFCSAATPQEKALDLKHIGVASFSINLNDDSLDEILLKLQPNWVFFDRFYTEEQFGWKVDELVPNCIKILDTQDFHSLRLGREKAYKKVGLFNTKQLFNMDHTKREIASMLRCDLNLIISTYEYDLLINQFKINSNHLFYIPFMVNKISPSDIKALPSYQKRKHFVTIGNFMHKPNFTSIQELKKNIWPLIRKKIPKAEMHVYGSYPSEKVNQLEDKKQGFYIKGRAKDAVEVVKNARVGLAPLYFGAGLKGKLFECMQWGTPSVTTSIGAEGINQGMDWNGAIENNYETFADRAVALYKKEILWQKAQENGFSILNKLFNPKDFQRSFISRLKELSRNLERHRQDNFIGEVLKHESLKSTKYLSKWIEEKNK